MKILLLTAFAFGLSVIGNAQQKGVNPSKVKFMPPVIVKDETPASKNAEAVKFTPPVIVTDKAPKVKHQRKKEKVKFTPPVIVKDPEKNP